MKEIEAYIYGHKIGTLLDFRGKIYFEYDQQFKELGLEISPIKLHTTKTPSAYINKDIPELYHGLAGVFHDSLPDKHGMAFINRYFERQGLKTHQISQLHKLAFIGNRGMGAIEYQPSEHEVSNEATNLVLNAQEAYAEMKQYIEDKDATISHLMSILDSVSPVGGGRPKMLIQYKEDMSQIKVNQFELAQGFKRGILKFDEAYYENQSIGLTKLEYVYMSMAQEAGINTAKFQLVEENGLHHLIVERFDRDEEDKKIHMSTASGLGHIDISVAQGSSYETLFHLTKSLTNSQEDIEELFRRMVFNALALNFDDHAKNFAYLMDRKGKWRLSPAYDITYSKGMAQQHITTIAGKALNFTRDDLLSIADAFLIKRSRANGIIEKTIEVLKSFESKAEEVGIERDEIKQIVQDINAQLQLMS